MKELYETVTKAHQNKEAKYNEDKKQQDEERRNQFKTIQQEFVNHIIKLAEEKIQLVSNDPNYLKTFVDVFRFSLPPKKTEDQNVEFKGHLYITIMEGPKDADYLEYFKSLNTEPTIDLLRKAFMPLKIHYGFLPKFGNVIQVRWDKGEEVIPQWSLINSSDFDQKKLKSHNNTHKNTHNHPHTHTNARGHTYTHAHTHANTRGHMHTHTHAQTDKQTDKQTDNRSRGRRTQSSNNHEKSETIMNAFDMMRQMNMMPRRKGYQQNNNNNQVHQHKHEVRKYGRSSAKHSTKYEQKNKTEQNTIPSSNVVVETPYDETEE